MPSEIINLHVGQAGIQLGNAVWELFSCEHGIGPDGMLYDNQESQEDPGLDTFFRITSKNKHIPRTVFCDMEPNVIGLSTAHTPSLDEIRTGRYATFFPNTHLINGTESAGNNFSRGFFGMGIDLSKRVFDRIRRIMEACESLQGFMIHRSLGGGTGTGLTCALFDYLSECKKKIRIEFPVYPAPNLPAAPVEPYNCVLGEHFSMDDIDISFMFDNEALFGNYKSRMSSKFPTYSDINRVVAQILSSITAGLRFESVLSNGLDVLTTNLVPYPRIHFPLINFSPNISKEMARYEATSEEQLTRSVFDKNNQLVCCNPLKGKFMSCALYYRGAVSPKFVYDALNIVKYKLHEVRFVDWCPTRFKVGISLQPPSQPHQSSLPTTIRQLTMITNTSAMGEVINRVTRKFHALYSRRCFVHWYIGEGLEEAEFTESLYNMASLVKDYEEVTTDWDNLRHLSSAGAGASRADQGSVRPFPAPTNMRGGAAGADFPPVPGIPEASTAEEEGSETQDEDSGSES